MTHQRGYDKILTAEVEQIMSSNPFLYTLDNKRYHTLNYHNKQKYGAKVHKAVLDCGFTCPNKDGSKGVGGCIFCDGGSGYFTSGAISVTAQLDKETKRITSKHGKDVLITAYFQANTNTYAPAEKLSELYSSVLASGRVHGISIGTRGDCLGGEVLDVLSELNEKTELTVELGMQSMHDSTIEYINRGCSHEDFLTGYFSLKERGIRTCIHIINGLPFETEEMMKKTASELARMKPDAVKIQMLHVIEGTRLADEYSKGKFSLLTREEYIDITVKQLELLPAETVIERITGDGDKTKLIAPQWSADKISVLGGIDKRMAELDTYQGRLYKPQSL